MDDPWLACSGSTRSERRIRALVIAEACNPEWESVPLEGWSHANALREYADLHIVTRAWNRPALLRAGLVEGQDFTALDTEALFWPMERLVERITGAPNRGMAMLTALTIPSYLLLEHLAWRRFGPAVRAGRFDLVHRLTPLSPAVPSLIAGHCHRAGVPFVLGPLNGGLPYPAGFPSLRRREGEWLSHLRGAYRLLPGYRTTRRRAAAIIVGSASALADLPKRWHDKTVYIPENGIELSRFPPPSARFPESYSDRPLRAVFLGRLVPYKGCDMLIEAAAPLLADGRMTLEIIGDGPEREALEALAAGLGVAEAITFTGKIPHCEVAGRLHRADLFPFPSVREFGGAVVLEAMAMGVVPIVVDYGGPGELVSPGSGFAIPLGTRAQVVTSLREVLEQVVRSPSSLAALSAQAVIRAGGLFAWPAKARQTLEVYRWVLGRRSDKPEPRLPLADPVAAASAGELADAAVPA